MAGRHKQPNFVREDFDNLQPFLLNRQLSNSEIREIIENGLNDPNAVRAVHQQLHVGKLLLEFRKNPGQNVDASRLIRRNEQLAAGYFLELVDGILGSPAKGQDLFGMLSEDTTGYRQRDVGPESLNQGGIQFLFKLPRLRADGRL